MKLPQYSPAKRLLLIAFVIAAALCAATCNSLTGDEDHSTIVNNKGEAFAGSDACAPCHQDITNKHRLTAHFRTSHPTDTSTVRGNFKTGMNVFVLNKQLKVIMEKTSKGVFQTGYVDGWEAISKPVDIVIGAGRKAQTFLYWDDDKLLQLPVSYYAPLDAWSNSPGYPTDRILFDRPITARCIECHGTYASTLEKDKVDRFDKSQLIFGVDCERCHGPAKAHVDFHTDHQKELQARFIINPANLDRQRRLDNCALCHAGVRKLKQPAFAFKTGNNLEEFSSPDYARDSVSALDVHGNQYGLLTASECFMASEMDCSSCHNVHEPESDLNVFSARCTSCHQNTDHSFMKDRPLIQQAASTNCIDCHMPALASTQVSLRVNGEARSIPELVRTHKIAIYDEQTKAFLLKLTAKQ